MSEVKWRCVCKASPSMNRSVTSVAFHLDIKSQGGIWVGQLRWLPRKSCNRILIQKQESFWPIQKNKICSHHKLELSRKMPWKWRSTPSWRIEESIYPIMFILMLFYCYIDSAVVILCSWNKLWLDTNPGYQLKWCNTSKNWCYHNECNRIFCPSNKFGGFYGWKNR